jgi:hypothetical protein
VLNEAVYILSDFYPGLTFGCDLLIEEILAKRLFGRILVPTLTIAVMSGKKLQNGVRFPS